MCFREEGFQALNIWTYRLSLQPFLKMAVVNTNVTTSQTPCHIEH